MRILLLGSGGREHALAWKINQSVWANPLYIAPGNAGTAQCGKNVSLDTSDFDAIGNFCISEKIEMVVVGPEEPLVKGLYDYFKANEDLQKIYFIGPSKNGAQLEGSKAFAKAFMERHKIPTAKYREFDASSFETTKPVAAAFCTTTVSCNSNGNTVGCTHLHRGSITAR